MVEPGLLARSRLSQLLEQVSLEAKLLLLEDFHCFSRKARFVICDLDLVGLQKTSRMSKPLTQNEEEEMGLNGQNDSKWAKSQCI